MGRKIRGEYKTVDNKSQLELRSKWGQKKSNSGESVKKIKKKYKSAPKVPWEILQKEQFEKRMKLKKLREKQ